MANEVNISATLRYAKSPASASLSTSYSADQTGTKYSAGVQIIGVTEESLDKNDVGTIGYLAVRNMDATNYVRLGATTTVYTIKLLPGKGCVVPWNGSTTFIIANAAPVEVEYLMIEA